MRIVALLIAIAATTPFRLPPTSVTSDASMATSVPVPIAKPTSACVSAGRVVDAVAYHPHALAFELELLHLVRLILRQHLGEHAVDADAARDRICRPLVVAGNHRDFDARAAERRDASMDSGLIVSATATMPAATPSSARYIGVLP